MLTRGQMGQSKPEEKKGPAAEEGRRPTFTKQASKKEDGGSGLNFRSSGGPAATTPKDDKPKPAEEKKEPSGPWRSSGPQSKPAG